MANNMTKEQREAKAAKKANELETLRNTVAEGWTVRETVTADPKLEMVSADGGRLVSLSVTFAAPISGADVEALQAVNKAERNAAAAAVICELFNTRGFIPSELLGAAVNLSPLMGSYGDSARNDVLRVATSDPYGMGEAFTREAYAAAASTREAAIFEAYAKDKARTKGAYIDYLLACDRFGYIPRADEEKGFAPSDFAAALELLR